MSCNRSAPVLLALVLLSAGALHAQGRGTVVTSVRQAIYIEAGGPAGVASINYDRTVTDSWAVRLGLEVDGSGPHISEWYPEIPITASYIAFSGDHHAEVGGGLVLTSGSSYSDGLDPTLHVGYRYQTPASPLFFRATLVRRASDHYRLPGLPVWGGIGLGYAF